MIIPMLAFSCITVTAHLPPRKSAFFMAAPLKDVKFCLITAAMFFMFVGMFSPLFYLPTYAVSRGVDATLASYLLAILNAASTFGRIIPGVLADKFGRLNVFTIGGFATGIVVFCMDQAKSTAGLVVYSIAVGFASGTIISGGSAALTICIKNPQEIGTYMGIAMGFASFAALIGPPVNGAMINHYHGFAEMSYFSGSMTIVGGFIALAGKAMTPQGIFGRI
jgi:MFS family permease